MAYATVEEASAYLSVVGQSAYADGTPLHALLGRCLTAASERIDQECDRSFVLAEDDPSDREFYTDPFVVTAPTWVLTDDFAAAPTQVAAADGQVLDEDGWRLFSPPKTGKAGHSLELWTTKTPKVTVTARWGWLTVPEPIKQAALMIGTQMFERQKKPLGFNESEQMILYLPRFSPGIDELLMPYKKVGPV